MVTVLTFFRVNAAIERPKLKVLAVNFPPFTAFDKQNGITYGVDVRLIRFSHHIQMARGLLTPGICYY